MTSQVLHRAKSWINSETNIFKEHSTEFEVITSPEYLDNQSVTVDIEIKGHIVRLTFWERGSGHIEVQKIKDATTVIDRGFDVVSELDSSEPFKSICDQLLV